MFDIIFYVMYWQKCFLLYWKSPKLACKFLKKKNKPILFKGQKNHLCDKCNASFTYLSTLNEHIQGASLQLSPFTGSIFLSESFGDFCQMSYVNQIPGIGEF